MSDGSAGDWGWIPRLGRSPGEGNGNPLQYSYLENSMDGGAWRATVHEMARSWTGLSGLTLFLSFYPVPGLFGSLGVSSVKLEFYIFTFMGLSLHD